MMKYVVMIVLVAMLAVSATRPPDGGRRSRRRGDPRRRPGKSPLAKTWTTGVQEKEAGSQVLATASLTSPVSFQAEGKGFEPATPCGAPHFQSDWTCVHYRLFCPEDVHGGRFTREPNSTFVHRFRQCPCLWLQNGYTAIPKLDSAPAGTIELHNRL